MIRHGLALWLAVSGAGAAHAGTELVINRQARADSVGVATTLFGPVQIRLQARDGTLLAERVVNGPGTFPISGTDGRGLNDILLDAFPGAPAKHDGSEYHQPFSLYADWSISQGFHGQASHQDDANRYAVDFALLLGTPVLAARSGTVMESIDGFPDTGSDRVADIDNGNRVRIRHEDGSMAVYGHLMQDSIRVKPGQWLATGTVLGQSGNSGYSRGPHLHFAVQINTGMRLQSVPIRIRAPDGTVIIAP